ncbi:MAG: hypothetical protein WBE14_26645 [Xanthobacteraceae bacterium]
MSNFEVKYHEDCFFFECFVALLPEPGAAMFEPGGFVPEPETVPLLVPSGPVPEGPFVLGCAYADPISPTVAIVAIKSRFLIFYPYQHK